MDSTSNKTTKRRRRAVPPVNKPRIIHDFGRDYIFDEAAQKIVAVTDPAIEYDFCEAGTIREALNCGEIDTLEMLWKDKDVPFRSLLSDNPSQNTHNDEFNFKMFGFTNCRKCGSTLHREDRVCSTCHSPTHLKTGC